MRHPRIEAHHIGILRSALRNGGVFVPGSRGQTASMGVLRRAGLVEKMPQGFWALTRQGVFRITVLEKVTP